VLLLSSENCDQYILHGKEGFDIEQSFKEILTLHTFYHYKASVGIIFWFGDVHNHKISFVSMSAKGF